MEKLRLTLSKALALVKSNAKKLDIIEDEIVAEARDKSFQGHDIYTMTVNKMLYYIATDDAMHTTLALFANDYEVDDYDRLKSMCRMNNHRSEMIISMKGIISLRLDALKLKEENKALNDYIENAFEPADFKRIKKADSIACLEALKLI